MSEETQPEKEQAPQKATKETRLRGRRTSYADYKPEAPESRAAWLREEMLVTDKPQMQQGVLFEESPESRINGHDVEL